MPTVHETVYTTLHIDVVVQILPRATIPPGHMGVFQDLSQAPSPWLFLKQVQGEGNRLQAV
jgi:hypothetical protein